MKNKRHISKEELEKIFEGLRKIIEIDEEWLQRLKKGFCCYWYEIFPDHDPDYDGVTYDIISRIHEILDSFFGLKGDSRRHSFDFLTKADLLEIAGIVKIQVPQGGNKRSILDVILEKIRMMCIKCKGSGKVGVADSTEGPQPIFCLDCRGTGKVR